MHDIKLNVVSNEFQQVENIYTLPMLYLLFKTTHTTQVKKCCEKSSSTSYFKENNMCSFQIDT